MFKKSLPGLFRLVIVNIISGLQVFFSSKRERALEMEIEEVMEKIRRLSGRDD